MYVPKLLLSTASVVLELHYFCQAVARHVLQLVVAFKNKIHEHWNQVLVDFWHVKHVDNLSQIRDQLNVLPPQSRVAFYVVDVDH